MTDTPDDLHPTATAPGPPEDAVEVTPGTVVTDEPPRWEEPLTRREERALAGPRRRWPAVLATFALLVVVAVGGAGFYVSRQIDPPGEPGAEVEVIIPEGTGASSIADLLEQAGIITNATIFSAYVKVKGVGDNWLAGRYLMRENSSFDDAITVLDAGPGAIPFDQVTVPEGYTVFASAGLPAPGTVVQRIVDRDNGIPRFNQQRIMELLLGGTLRSQFQPPDVGSLEGMLFPDTYRVEREEGPNVLLTDMVERFDQIAAESGIGDATSRVRQATGGAVEITPYQAIIVASLIEREARVPEERPMMARVIYNRLADGTVLGIDASLNYALGHPATLESELATDSPYNLREVAGLPPTPIAVPGRASLEAAVAPAAGEWRYYVLSDEAGHHTFTNTYDEFLDAKAQCQAAGLC
jgi:UPF0755 protein